MVEYFMRKYVCFSIFRECKRILPSHTLYHKNNTPRVKPVCTEVVVIAMLVSSPKIISIIHSGGDESASISRYRWKRSREQRSSKAIKALLSINSSNPGEELNEITRNEGHNLGTGSTDFKEEPFLEATWVDCRMICISFLIVADRDRSG